MDGPTRGSLQALRVANAEELLALSPDELAGRLINDAPFPASEKVIGAVVLKAVAELHRATRDLEHAAAATDSKTAGLLKAAYATLGVAAVTLAVAIVSLLR
jgi:hypothetical protein